MLLLALSCRHATPPQTVATEQQEVLDTAVAPCDTNAFVGSLQVRLGPQECNTDSDCTTHSLAELASMMPVDASQRLGHIDEPDSMVGSRSLLLGPETTLASVVEPATDLVRACIPRHPRPGYAVGTDGRVFHPRRAESAEFMGEDGVVREQCIAELPTPGARTPCAAGGPRCEWYRARDSAAESSR